MRRNPTNVHKIRPDTTAQHYPIEMDLSRALRQARATRQLGDLIFPELLDEIRDLRAHGIYPAAALMEAHQRVAGAVACLAFTLIGIPLGIKTSRRETSVGMALSIGLALSFYFMMILANTLKRAAPRCSRKRSCGRRISFSNFSVCGCSGASRGRSPC